MRLNQNKNFNLASLTELLITDFYNLFFDSSNSASTTIELFDEIPPEAEIYFDSNTQKLVVKGIDNTTVNPIVSIIATDKKQTIYQIKDEAGNTTKLYFDKLKQEGKQIKAELDAIQYNGEPIIESKVELKYEWSLNKDGTVKELEQRIKAEDQFDVKAKYNHQKDETEIKIKEKDNEEIKRTLSGLAIIKLITKSGILDFEY